MGGNIGVSGQVSSQEGGDGDIVRKISDLPDGGLDIITIITENFYKNELLEILTVNPTYKNQEMFIIDDSPKMEELYDRYFGLGDYQGALSICISMIQREVVREYDKGRQCGFKINNGASDIPTLENISTPIALEWKQRIGEIQDMMYSKFVEEGKTKEALELCNFMIQIEVKREYDKGRQFGFKINNGASDIPTLENISTPTALKWKKRVKELTETL